MRRIDYILKAFGFENVTDYGKSVVGGLKNDFALKLLFVSALGSARYFVESLSGLDIAVFFAFVFLIVAEFWTGIRVSLNVKKEKVQSRKMGRMILKIGTYIAILSVLNVFAINIDAPDVAGVEMNPFKWLYYTVFIAIVFQLVISWFENLGELGYKETRTIAGFILRKFNTWFEFEGNKSNRDK